MEDPVRKHLLGVSRLEGDLVACLVLPAAPDQTTSTESPDCVAPRKGGWGEHQADRNLDKQHSPESFRDFFSLFAIVACCWVLLHVVACCCTPDCRFLDAGPDCGQGLDLACLVL